MAVIYPKLDVDIELYAKRGDEFISAATITVPIEIVLTPWEPNAEARAKEESIREWGGDAIRSVTVGEE